MQQGITLFTVILLIGSGWSFVKPFLSDRERNMILAILVLQVINNIAIVVLTQETEGENAFDKWTAVLHLVDILCCCAVLIPIVWQVNQLEKNMEQNQHHDEDGDAQDANGGADRPTLYDIDEFDDEHVTEDELEEVPINGNSSRRTSTARPPDDRLAAKLKLFRSFYLLVVAYIYITRIVVYLFASFLNYRHAWVRYFVVEVVTLIFYCTVGMLFRPMNENPYLHLRRRPDAGRSVGGKGREAQVELRKIDSKSKAVMD
jgi:G protein-coupled receptor 107